MHPSLRILALILLAVAVQFLLPMLLGLSGAALLLTAAFLYPLLLRRTLRRSRWLLLTLLLVYAFATPGEYVAGWPVHAAPTYEGLNQGLLQAGRLLAMLGGLALLLGSTPCDALVAGLFQLFSPLRYLGLPPQRFAARLWLTLHYVEQAPLHTQGSPWARLEQLAFADAAVAVERISFSVPRFRPIDWLAAALMALILVWMLA